MDENSLKVSTDEVQKDFLSFLSIADNSKILFSGKFGIGKTTFLKDFFDKNKDGFDTYHIYPINYQISQNDDVLELIKLDILTELSNKYSDIFTEDPVLNLKESTALFLTWFLNNTSINTKIELTESVLNTIPIPLTQALAKLGRPLKDFNSLLTEFKDFRDNKSEKKIISKFIENIKKKNIAETDYISDVIKQKVHTKKEKKESVLIIDDLDRMDPEHIFRILNTFSAYFEQDGTNKFGFDKIIIVADYQNLKHIFHHKYGPETDFSGYIDKFYSIETYNFDIKKAIKFELANIIFRFKVADPDLKSGLHRESGYLFCLFKYILLNSIDNSQINLRQLFQPVKHLHKELQEGRNFQSNDYSNFIITKTLKVCMSMFSKESLIRIIKSADEIEDVNGYDFPYDKFIQTMIMKLKVIPNPESGTTVNIKGVTDGNYRYDLSRENGSRDFNFSFVEGNKQSYFNNLLIRYIENIK